jgi:tRNA threonylcarbamoyl adenosine modification protein (Sua5/YciO/YrdC/YwlC family)
MAIFYSLHPETPQARIVEQIQNDLQGGAVMLYPTDTVYAIGCDLYQKSAVERVRQLKRLANDKPLTFLSSSLSDIANYARVTDTAYRIMKCLIPGTYTFILPGTKLVPRLVMSPKRKTIGIRVPDHAGCQAILQVLGHPIVSTSAHLPDEQGEFPTLGLEKAKLFDSLEGLVDIIVDDGSPTETEPSTILDLTTENPQIVRKGQGWEAMLDWIELT